MKGRTVCARQAGESQSVVEAIDGAQDPGSQRQLLVHPLHQAG